MSYGITLLSRDDVMEGIAEMIPEVQVEATLSRRNQISNSP